MGHSKGNPWEPPNRPRKPDLTGTAVSRVARLAGSEAARLGPIARGCRYAGWQFVVEDRVGRPPRLAAFRAHPETGGLQRLGPWDLPEDAGVEEVRAAALAAVVAVDGDSARDRFAFRCPESGK